MRSDSIKKAKDGVSGGVFYLGLAVIGVLAIPADRCPQRKRSLRCILTS